MGVGQYQKPETALQRAMEFISVGKERDGLDTLHDVMKDRRQKTWTPTIEQIMLKHVELCVNLRNSSYAKDALFHYKALSQQTSITSFEMVLRKFLETAESKTSDAQKSSIERVEEIDDLDLVSTPENLLLSVVSGAVTQDRMDRAVLSPWLRFLWDSYRNCLDMLRNNQMFEQLYHEVARSSFNFCLKYQRRTEFRKLCETLRLHLSQIVKNQLQNNSSIKLNNIESLQLMQETRSIQLDTAIKMELWQEAYKSAEDLHGMMQLSKDIDKKMVKPVSYANYYDKLALIFWQGGNTLFHAAALMQKFAFKDVKKSLNNEDHVDQANKVLLAVMSIPNDADKPGMLSRLLDFTEQFHTNVRTLSSLLRLQTVPTRSGLINDVTRMNILSFAHPVVRNMYEKMEFDFSPLDLAEVITKGMNQLSQLNKNDFDQYQSTVNCVAATKIFKQISLLYDCINIDKLKRLIPFYNQFELERFIVDICKQRFVRARIDHRGKSITFIRNDESLCGDYDPIDQAFFNAGCEKPNEFNIRNVLGYFFSDIRSTWLSIERDIRKVHAEDIYKHQLRSYLNSRDRIQKEIMKRKETIENYKETKELVKQERARKAAEAAKIKKEKETADEMKKLEVANRIREAERRELEAKENQEKIRLYQLNQIKENPLYKQIIKEKGEEAFASLNPEEIMREHRQRMENEERTLSMKKKNQEKKFDHTVRALHALERPQLDSLVKGFNQEAADLFAVAEAKRVEKAIADHEADVAAYNLVESSLGDIEKFCNNVFDKHKDEYERELAQWEAEVKAREARIAEERLQQRIRDRQEKERLAREEEERKRKEEERQKQIEAENERSRQLALEKQKQKEKTIADADENWRRRPVESNDAPKTISPIPKVNDRKSIPRSNPFGNAKPIEIKRSVPLSDNSAVGAPKRIETGNRGHMFNRNQPPKIDADADDNWRRGPAPSSSTTTAPRSGVNEQQSPAQQQPNNTDNEGWSINSNKRVSSGRQENAQTSNTYRPPYKQIDSSRRSNQPYGNNTNTRNAGSNRNRNNQTNTGSDASSWR
uniref:Eukaryotic translation initiation factor 3 subunit A n=1 Tax=Strongyloides venezuelensis TaxID=75913 RepID=A0A0K0G0D7_STRVS